MPPNPLSDIDTKAAGAGTLGAAAGGAAEASTGAVRSGLRVASRQLTRVQEMLQQMGVSQAMDGIRNALGRVAGQSAATFSPHASDMIHHLPEVMA